ncbi:MAG: GIY-YIG nuclease family protein [Candidatus Taylorbacteria bacterium]|nr:GIY-YIG nuclease family protein [Candidatus Taylorbacteria bacterium]
MANSVPASSQRRDPPLEGSGLEKLMNYFTYVLRSQKDGNLYIGYSENPERRLTEHNSGKTRSLVKRRPLILIYKEEFDDELKAKRRERFLKSGQGRKYLKSIIDNK